MHTTKAGSSPIRPTDNGGETSNTRSAADEAGSSPSRRGAGSPPLGLQLKRPASSHSSSLARRLPNELLDKVVKDVSPSSLVLLNQADPDIRKVSDTVTARLHAAILEKTIKVAEADDLDTLFSAGQRLSKNEWEENVSPRTLRDLQTPELGETLSKLPAQAAQFVDSNGQPMRRAESFTRMREFAHDEMKSRTHSETPAIASKLLAAQLCALNGLKLNEQRTQRTEIVNELRELQGNRLHEALDRAIGGLLEIASDLPPEGANRRGETILCLLENVSAILDLAFVAADQPQCLNATQREQLLGKLDGLIDPLKHTSVLSHLVCGMARGGATLGPEAGERTLKILALRFTDYDPSESFGECVQALFYSTTARFSEDVRADVYGALIDCLARRADFNDHIDDAASGVAQRAIWHPNSVEPTVDRFLMAFAHRAAAAPPEQRREAQDRYKDALVTVGLNIAKLPSLSRGLGMVLRHVDSIGSWEGGPHAHQLQQDVRRGLIAAAFKQHEEVERFTALEQLSNAMARQIPAHSLEWNRAFAVECSDPAHEPVLREIVSQRTLFGSAPTQAEVEQRLRHLRTEPNYENA
jgi:hypothetical protein